MRANQLRLYLSSAAYMLMHALRRLGLKGTDMARAQCHTIRLELLKIGARIRLTVRHVWIAMSEGYPWAGTFATALRNLQSVPPLLTATPLARPKTPFDSSLRPGCARFRLKMRFRTRKSAFHVFDNASLCPQTLRHLATLCRRWLPRPK